LLIATLRFAAAADMTEVAKEAFAVARLAGKPLTPLLTSSRADAKLMHA
jgi:hypothetical protein